MSVGVGRSAFRVTTKPTKGMVRTHRLQLQQFLTASYQVPAALQSRTHTAGRTVHSGFKIAGSKWN